MYSRFSNRVRQSILELCMHAGSSNLITSILLKTINSCRVGAERAWILPLLGDAGDE